MAKKSDEILLATDPEREGEAIALHTGEIIGEAILLTGIYLTSNNKGDHDD